MKAGKQLLCRGSAELVIIIIVGVALIGIVGWKAWDALYGSGSKTPDDSQAVNVKPAAPINSTADLANTDADLQKLDIDSDDTSKLDEELAY